MVPPVARGHITQWARLAPCPIDSRAVRAFAIDELKSLVKVKIDFHHDLNSDWVPLVHGRSEFVLPHSLDRFFIQAHSEMASNPDVLGIAFSIDNELKSNGALEIG